MPFFFFFFAGHCSRCNINEKTDTKVTALKDIPFGRQMISNKHSQQRGMLVISTKEKNIEWDMENLECNVRGKAEHGITES